MLPQPIQGIAILYSLALLLVIIIFDLPQWQDRIFSFLYNNLNSDILKNLNAPQDEHLYAMVAPVSINIFPTSLNIIRQVEQKILLSHNLYDLCSIFG